MTKFEIIVLDYEKCICYKHVVYTEKDFFEFNVEEWLKNNTDYNDSNCYYMCSVKGNEIPIKIHTFVEESIKDEYCNSSNVLIDDITCFKLDD